jgi:hypothetical protein
MQSGDMLWLMKCEWKCVGQLQVEIIEIVHESWCSTMTQIEAALFPGTRMKRGELNPSQHTMNMDYE